MKKLVKKIVFTGTIQAVTGLHIGGTNLAMSIGGTDKTVVRNPLTNEPYIPGSSFKGKMRSLLELATGKLGNTRMGAIENGPYQGSDAVSTKLFGNALSARDEAQGHSQAPSRVIVRDAHLRNGEVFNGKTELPFTEVKTEVVIDRITSKAMPRQMERVPEGAEFKLNIVLNIFETDDENLLLSNLFRAMRLVQDDYLGGSGSRGYGQIKLKIIKAESRSLAFYGEMNGTPEDILSKVPAELKA